MTPCKAARKRLGMTIYDVAKSAALTPASISRIENQKQTASPDAAFRLAKILGITEEKILYPERFPDLAA